MKTIPEIHQPPCERFTPTNPPLLILPEKIYSMTRHSFHNIMYMFIHGIKPCNRLSFPPWVLRREDRDSLVFCSSPTYFCLGSKLTVCCISTLKICNSLKSQVKYCVKRIKFLLHSINDQMSHISRN